MKVKLQNTIFVNGTIPALRKLLDERLSVSHAYELRKLSKQIEEKAKIFDEARMKLVMEHADKDKKGELQYEDESKTRVKIKTPEKFSEEFVKLLKIEEEYELSKKMKLGDDVKISTVDLALLEQLLDLPK